MFSQPMQFPGGSFDRQTHYVFRYPAKFHPPVARALIERFATLAFTPVGDTREQFAAFIRSEIAKWGKAVRESGARAE